MGKVRVIPIYEKQAEFRRSESKLKAFVGGRGTGKTYIGALDVSMRAKDGEPWVCVSPDYNVITETTFPTFIEVTQKTGQYLKAVKSPLPRVTFRSIDGGTASLVFRSAEKPDKLRGGSYAGVWMDEATVIVEEAYDLIRPTLRHKGVMGPTIITATPKGTRHWTFEKLFERVEISEGQHIPPGVQIINGLPYRIRKGRHLIQASSKDNPFLPPDFYESIKSDYGTMLAAQELEGEFVEIAGLMFKREWFEMVDRAPIDCFRVRYWDQAATHGSGCYTAGVLMARDDYGRFYVEHVIRGQWGPLERNRVIDQITESDSRKYQGRVLTFVEQEGGSGGKEIAAQMISRLAGHAVFRDVVSGKRERVSSGEKLPGEAKIVRAMPFAAQAEAGNVRIVRAEWNENYLGELCAFPEYKYADQVDASSGSFNKLVANDTGDPGAIYRPETRPENSERFGALAAIEQSRTRWGQIPWAQENFNETME